MPKIGTAIIKGLVMHASKIQAGFVASSIVVLLMTACGGGGGGTTSVTTTVLSAYVANSGDGTISQYTINPSTGALTPKSPATICSMIVANLCNTSSFPASVAIDPTNKYAYVANSADQVISQFTIGPGGVLQRMNPATVLSGSAGSGPTSIAIDPSGKYAYSANSLTNDIAQFIVDPITGALTPMAPPTVSPCSPATTCTQGIWPISITVDPLGKYVYVANQTDNSVSQFIIGPSGALTPMATATVAGVTTPSSITVDPSGNFAYVTNNLATPNASITQFSIASGALTSPTTPGLGSVLTLPTSMAIDPSGTHAYLAHGSGIYPYTINASGLLDNMNPINPTGGTAPQSVAIDSLGKFVYVANKGSDNISQFNIGAGGALSTPTVTQGAVGSQPYSITTAVLKL